MRGEPGSASSGSGEADGPKATGCPTRWATRAGCARQEGAVILRGTRTEFLGNARYREGVRAGRVRQPARHADGRGWAARSCEAIRPALPVDSGEETARRAPKELRHESHDRGLVHGEELPLAVSRVPEA